MYFLFCFSFGYFKGFWRPGTSDQTVSNFGLLDQIAALQWVKDNIQSFGGKVDSVSLVGHGTGAACVNLLMLSPVAKGMYLILNIYFRCLNTILGAISILLKCTCIIEYTILKHKHICIPLFSCDCIGFGYKYANFINDYWISFGKQF